LFFSPLQVQIGNADYSTCSCVRYVTSADQTDHMTADHRLTIGLAVGLGLLLIIIIIIIVIAVIICRRRGIGEERIAYSNNGTGSVDLDQDDAKYYN